MTNRTVTHEQVVATIAKEEFIDHNNKTTIGIFTLRNGFVIVEASSCVCPANYMPEIGRSICRKRAVEKIWELEGYSLQSELNGEDC